MGPSPVDRGRQSSRTHVLVDKNGIPVSFAISGGNEHEVNAIEQTLLETMLVDHDDQPIHPRGLALDKGYDSKLVREAIRKLGNETHIRKRREPPLLGLVRQKPVRWVRVVERTGSWMGNFRGIVTRWDTRADTHIAVHALAFAWIIYSKLAT